MLNIIAADQAGVMNLIIDAEFKQNSKLFVHNGQVRSAIMDKEREQGCFFVHETLPSWSGYNNFPRLNVNMCYFQQLLWKAGIPLNDG